MHCIRGMVQRGPRNARSSAACLFSDASLTSLCLLPPICPWGSPPFAIHHRSHLPSILDWLKKHLAAEDGVKALAVYIFNTVVCRVTLPAHTWNFYFYLEVQPLLKLSDGGNNRNVVHSEEL